MIGAVVLAAGASSRMGRDKAGLRLPDGTTFLDAILKTLTRLRIPTSVVVASGNGGNVSGASVVVNPDTSRGMLSSVQCGLSNLPTGIDAFLLWPVDHPLVQLGTVAMIIAASRAHRAPVVVPVHEGRRGHPTLFAGVALEQLARLPLTATAADVVHAHEQSLLELAVSDAGVVCDIDDPQAYEKAFGVKP